MDKDHVELVILGIFAAFGFILFLVLLGFFKRGYEAQQNCGNKDNPENSSLRRLPRCLTAERSALVVPSILREFSLLQLEEATDKFCASNLIKAGHSGDIFSGVLDGGDMVVIKRIEVNKSERDFYHAEMDVYARVLDQRFMVPLLGQCLEGGEKLLVYKRMPNGDLATALAKAKAAAALDDEQRTMLSWIWRLKIATEVARALAYLHDDCRPRWAHRNIEASSILLGENFEPKLGSFSEAERLEGGALPLYDIYCFGKLLLDLVLGLDDGWRGSSGCGEEGGGALMRWTQAGMGKETQGSAAASEWAMEGVSVAGEEKRKEVLGVAMVARACMDAKKLQELSMKRVVELLESPQRIVELL